MINPQWFELPMSRTNFHGPKDVRATEVRLYCVVLPVYLSQRASRCTSTSVHHGTWRSVHWLRSNDDCLFGGQRTLVSTLKSSSSRCWLWRLPCTLQSRRTGGHTFHVVGPRSQCRCESTGLVSLQWSSVTWSLISSSAGHLEMKSVLVCRGLVMQWWSLWSCSVVVWWSLVDVVMSASVVMASTSFRCGVDRRDGICRCSLAWTGWRGQFSPLLIEPCHWLIFVDG